MSNIKDCVQHLVVDKVRKDHRGHRRRIERRTDGDCPVNRVVVAEPGPAPPATPSDLRDIYLAVEEAAVHFLTVTAKHVVLPRGKHHLPTATQPPLPHGSFHGRGAAE